MDATHRNGEPIYDPAKSYAENFSDGPFGDFADGSVFSENGTPEHTFLGFPVHTPFGIPAGPLLNGAFVKAALDKGFNLPVYKTVRTRKHPCHAWPNVLAVRVHGDLAPGMQRLTADQDYSEPLSITNSFGVPSFDPDFWQPDLADAVQHAGAGQVVIGSYQGTGSGASHGHGGSVEDYIADFVLGARLLKETGVKILEVNLSCPNEGTANLLCYDVERAQRIAEAIKAEVGDTPLIAKCGYFADDVALRNLLLALGGVVDGIAAINTISAEIVDSEGRQALPGEGRLRSGVCGHAIKWAGVEMTRRMKALREELGQRFVIVGVGGVTRVEDYVEYREAGADAVMSAAGAMWNPLLAQQIKQAVRAEAFA